MLMCFFLMIRRPPRSTLFPTRRSSDLEARVGHPHLGRGEPRQQVEEHREHLAVPQPRPLAEDDHAGPGEPRVDRKSTRLNSSHANISYAVFCLKKKKNTTITLSTHMLT